MYKLLIMLLFAISSTIFSQELDDAYLESLPDDIRNDVMEKIDMREEIDKPIYRRSSTMVDKKTLTKLRFGDNFFDMMQSSFMPINEPNFDSTYVLDFGDTLEIQLIGQKSSIEQLAIKRDGSINIQDIGKIFVSGLSLESVNKLIKSKISSAYIGVEAFVTLVNVRDIQVLVTGNAFNPGIYTLNGNSNLLHALAMAGGVDENGSYRKIDLIRNDEVIKSLDLYDVFIYGRSGFGERLRSGDIILIQPSLKLVSISGAVKRPGLYELNSDNSFLDLIEFANGFADNADLKTIRIERPFEELTKFISIKNLDDISSIKVKSSDSFNVRAYERKTVSVLGAVNSPGIYTISEGETLSSLIKKAQGYKNNAYPFAGILNNVKALEINKIAADKLYNSFIQKLITRGDALFASESLPFILDELKNTNLSGRVMAEFDLDVIKANPSLDTTLDDGDKLIIPIQSEQIYIFGEVNQPGAIRYKPSSNLEQYIADAGGTLSSADNSNIFVIHPNGEVIRSSDGKWFSKLNNDGNNSLIYPETVIYIPRKVAEREASMVASIWAPIISSAATSITALSVLNNQ